MSTKLRGGVDVTGEAKRIAAQEAAQRVVGALGVVNNIHARPAGALVPAPPLSTESTRLPSVGLQILY